MELILQSDYFINQTSIHQSYVLILLIFLKISNLEWLPSDICSKNIQLLPSPANHASTSYLCDYHIIFAHWVLVTFGSEDSE